jgi:hypothetical protein
LNFTNAVVLIQAPAHLALDLFARGFPYDHQ